MKLKNIFLVLVLTLVFVACKKDDETTFDPARQAKIDDEALIKYLKSHYYESSSVSGGDFGKIDSLNKKPEAVSIYDDSRLIKKIVKSDGIDHNLYYLRINEGGNLRPSVFDSIFIKYKGSSLEEPTKTFDVVPNFTSLRGWQNLFRMIEGWKEGVPEFKSGFNTTNEGEPLTYSNNGVGVLFIPSGLAYKNIGSRGRLINQPLIFHIELAQVNNDFDRDTLLNKYEDIDNDGNLNNDDTDGDKLPDYLDNDDDGDGTLTKDENPDPNGDGNPDDAKDSDNDGTPDYLDPDTK